MNEQTIKSNKIQLSLAAILFFSFFVRKLLQENTMELDDQAKKFVQSYILYGYGILLISLCTIIGTIVYYFIPSQIIYWLHTTGAIVIIIAIIVGIVGVFNDSQLIQNNNTIQPIKITSVDTKNIITAYIPLYNIYLWYKLHNFDKPYRRAKESIIARLLFILVTFLIQSPIFSVVIIIAIITRIATLLGGINIVHDDIQKNTNTLFYKNPEEIRGYVTGIITSIIHYLTSHIRETQETIKQHKLIYQKLSSIRTPQVRVEAGIAAILVIRWTVNREQTIDVRVYYLASMLIIGRYIVLGRKRKHLPYIPGVHELVEGVKLLLNKYFPGREDRFNHLSPQK